jgi:preprotein translocase subunit Sss1
MEESSSDASLLVRVPRGPEQGGAILVAALGIGIIGTILVVILVIAAILFFLRRR